MRPLDDTRVLRTSEICSVLTVVSQEAVRNGHTRQPSRLFVFVGFSDDRRLALVVRFGVVVFVLVIIIVIVGVSRRHRVAHDGDEPPLGREKSSGTRWVMSVPCWISRHS
jgi:hypothetical protein